MKSVGRRKQNTFPTWFSDLQITARQREKLTSTFTIHRDGYVIWYQGQTRAVCGKSTPPESVGDSWAARRKQIDLGLTAQVRRAEGGITYREASSEYFAWLDHRIETKKPRPISPYTRLDCVRFVTRLGRSAGADRPLADYSADDFTKYAKEIADVSPSTFTRVVANVRAFFKWCVSESILASQPSYGNYFARSPRQSHRDVRLSQSKSYSPAEMRLLWFHATFEEKLWIALGLCGAFDNADLANFSRELIDWKAGTIDYRRRKVGLVRRVIPLPSDVLDLLKLYERCKPADEAHDDRFFLTEKGFPLGRIVVNGVRVSVVDAVSRQWGKLLARAGLRKKPSVTRVNGRRKLNYSSEAVRELSQSQYRLRIKYSVREGDTMRVLDSEVNIKAGEEIELAGTNSGNSRSGVVVSVKAQ